MSGDVKYLCRDTDSIGPDSLGPHYHTWLFVKLLEESHWIIWFPLEAHLPLNAPTKALHSSWSSSTPCLFSVRHSLFTSLWPVALVYNSWENIINAKGLPRWHSRICLPMQETGLDLWVSKIPWSRKWQSTTVFLPWKFHGQRSLVGYMGFQIVLRHDRATHINLLLFLSWMFWNTDIFEKDRLFFFFLVDYPSIWIFLKFPHDYIQFMPFLGRTNLEVILCTSQDIISGVTWCHYVPSLVMLTSQWQLLGSSTVKLLFLWKVLLSLDKYAFPYQSFPLMIFV